MPDLLLELGVEEIPAGYIRGALAELKARAEARLEAAGLKYRSVVTTATPRRLVLAISELPVAQAAREEEVSGPPESAAFLDGQPTKAALGFAKKQGVEASALYVKDTPKGRYVHARKRYDGRAVGDILLEVLPDIVAGMSWPKSMRWPQAEAVAAPPVDAAAAAGNGGGAAAEAGSRGAAKAEKPAALKGKGKKDKKPKPPTFARPVRRVLCVLGNQVLPLELFGLRAGRATSGHPYLTYDREIALERADYPAYRALLKGHFVIADRNERRALIRQELERLLEEHGAELRHDDLVEEVTDLVEHPEVLIGQFAARYLELPQPIVEAAMTEHQRYFPIASAKKGLEAAFAFVADRTRRTADVIVEGNERVLAARLEDAMFYLKDDLKTPLADRDERMAGVVFHEKLGTLRDRARRLERLAEVVADLMQLEGADRAATVRAATLCKADLTTDLVAEFPKLQGEIGAEYASRQGEDAAVVTAIREHYLPRFAGDRLPKSPAGMALSLADKLDHLAGFFGAGYAPTGSADPYALRRQALGIVRLVAERELSLSVDDAIRAAAAGLPDGLPARDGLEAALGTFLGERFAAFLRDERELPHDLVEAVLKAHPIDDFRDVQRRAEAVQALSREADFGALCELVERTYNISKPLDDPDAGVERRPVREDLLREPEEAAVWKAWARAKPAFEAHIEQARYEPAARTYLDELKEPVHAFFDKVFVNVDDQDVRMNRMALCRELHDAFARSIADLTTVTTGRGDSA